MLSPFDFGDSKPDTKNELLEKAREIARSLCVKAGSCDADQVGRIMAEKYGIPTLGPLAGSIFKSAEFEHTGRFVRSSRKTNHGRILFKWKLKGT